MSLCALYGLNNSQECNFYGLFSVCYCKKNFNDLYVRKHRPVAVLFQMFEHIYRHIVEGKMVVPTPIFARMAVVDAGGPTVSNFLTEIRRIADGEIRNVLLDFGSDFGGCKTHCGQVVRRTNLDLLRWRLHNLDGSRNGVVHIHHWHFGFGGQETFVGLVFEGFVVNIYRIIRSTADWRRRPTNQARITDAAHVYTKKVVIIFAPSFA